MLLKNHIFINSSFKSQDETINGLIGALGFPDDIRDCVHQREANRSTAVPEGIAFPHCHCDSIDHIQLAITTFKEPIYWGIVPVRIVVLLCSTKKYTLYVRTLAAMCRILHNEEDRCKILNAINSDEIFDVITTHQAFITL